MKVPTSQVRDFLKQISARRADRLEAYLDENVTYELVGLPPVEGRHGVLQLWRRKFQSYAEISMLERRNVVDGDVVLTHQRQIFASKARPPVILDGWVVFEFRGARIALWRTFADLADVPAEELELWRRLRTARW